MHQVREPESNNKETFPDICVCCGAPVPEGVMVCWNCEHKNDVDEIDYFRPKRDDSDKTDSGKITIRLPY